jgi:hypothetical protein
MLPPSASVATKSAASSDAFDVVWSVGSRLQLRRLRTQAPALDQGASVHRAPAVDREFVPRCAKRLRHLS